MQTVYIGFGREINVLPFKGRKVASKARGVWLLSDADWMRFIRLMREACEGYGRIVFGGEGKGLNTVTGEHDETGYCIALEITDGRWLAIDKLQTDLEKVASMYGQREFAMATGYSKLVLTGA